MTFFYYVRRDQRSRRRRLRVPLPPLLQRLVEYLRNLLAIALLGFDLTQEKIVGHPHFRLAHVVLARGTQRREQALDGVVGITRAETLIFRLVETLDRVANRRRFVRARRVTVSAEVVEQSDQLA